jgi:hypothetical protein
MPTIFESHPGVVVAIQNSEDVPLALNLDGWQGFQGFGAILTGISINLQGSYQFQHTLGDLIYSYVFGGGRRISSMQVAGAAFAGSCQAGVMSGIDNVLSYYEQFRIGARAAPVAAQIGTSPAGYFEAFLTGAAADISHPEGRICQFALNFHVLPNRS